MSYSAWSVVYLEVPSDAKWNQLASNDESFRDGTGLDDDIILPRHIDTDVMWKELGREKLTSPNRRIDISFTPTKVLHVLCDLSVTSMGTWQNVFSFNNNAGANSYTYRYSDDYGSDTTDGNSSGFGVGGIGNNVGRRICRMDIVNEPTEEKIVFLETMYNIEGETPSSPTAAPHINQQSCKWTGVANQVSRITCYAGLPSFDAGSEMVILGHD